MKRSFLAVVFGLLLLANAGTAFCAAATPGGTLVIGRPSDAISLDSNTETTAPGAIVYCNIIRTLDQNDG